MPIMPTRRLPLWSSLALSLGVFLPFLATEISAAESEAAEAATIAVAAKPGPSRSKALAELGQQKPVNVAKVVAVLVDAVVSKDVVAQITAKHALDSLASFPENRPEAQAVRDALNPHGERLLAAAATQKTELTNSPIEALAMLSRPEAKLVPGLLKLHTPGTKFRRYTLATLAKVRPLTPEIRQVLLSDTDPHWAMLQDLAISLESWTAEELAGDDVDVALTRLFDDQGPRVLLIAQKRAKPCPRLLARLRELIAYPGVPDGDYSNALNAFSELGERQEVQALAERLLLRDPRLDPDRYGKALLLVAHGRTIPAPVVTHLLTLANDQSLDRFLRRAAAGALTARQGVVEATPVLTELSEYPYWTNDVHSAIHQPLDGPGVDEHLAKAASDEERAVWSLIKPLAQAMKPHAQDEDFNQRAGAWAAKFLFSWAEANPAKAWDPAVVNLTLTAFLLNYQASEAEKSQVLNYIKRLIAQGVFASAALRDARYPTGGAAELRSTVHEALSMALRTAVKSKTKGRPDIMATSLFEPLRHLREFKAPELLIRHAERQVAQTIRHGIQTKKIDPASMRAPLQECGFSLVPIDVLLEEASGERGAIK